MEWEPRCPPEQILDVEDGDHLVTLCSDTPPSGVLGDGQTIEVYLARLGAMPRLALHGIPTLCG
jgi:hypothetical protein